MNYELKEKDKIYKLRGILGDGTTSPVFNEEKEIDDEKTNRIMEEQAQALDGIEENFIDEIDKSNIVDEALDKLREQKNSSGYSLSNVKLIKLLDKEYIRENYDRGFTFREHISEGLDNNEGFKKHKEDKGEGDGSFRVIDDLKDYLIDNFALELVELVETKAKELVDELELKKNWAMSPYNLYESHGGHFKQCHTGVKYECPSYNYGNCDSFRTGNRWINYLTKQIGKRHEAGNVDNYNPSKYLDSNTEREIANKYCENKEGFNDWAIGSDNLTSREINFINGNDE